MNSNFYDVLGAAWGDYTVYNSLTILYCKLLFKFFSLQ